MFCGFFFRANVLDFAPSEINIPQLLDKLLLSNYSRAAHQFHQFERRNQLLLYTRDKMKQSWLEGTALNDGAIHRLGNSSLDTRFLRFQRWIIPWNLARSVRCRNASVITFQPFSFASQPFYSQLATNYRFLLTERNCNELRPIFVDYLIDPLIFSLLPILSYPIRSPRQHDSDVRQQHFYLLKN